MKMAPDSSVVELKVTVDREVDQRARARSRAIVESIHTYKTKAGEKMMRRTTFAVCGSCSAGRAVYRYG